MFTIHEEEYGLKFHYTKDLEWCAIEREDGIFLVYKRDTYGMYVYRENKFCSLEDAENYVKRG